MPTTPSPDDEIASPIRCILSDVDGVLTDGRIIYDAAGIETKQFHVRDGLGIKLWMSSGFQFGIVTSRNSQVVSQRASELGVTHVAQGCGEKLPAARAMLDELNCQPDQACYIGDDLPDIPVMQLVGLAVVPADASTDTAGAAHWVLKSRGGEGVVRELIERLLRAKHRWEEHIRH